MRHAQLHAGVQRFPSKNRLHLSGERSSAARSTWQWTHWERSHVSRCAAASRLSQALALCIPLGLLVLQQKRQLLNKSQDVPQRWPQLSACKAILALSEPVPKERKTCDLPTGGRWLCAARELRNPEISGAAAQSGGSLVSRWIPACDLSRILAIFCCFPSSACHQPTLLEVAWHR